MATFETLEEAKAVLTMSDNHSHLKTKTVFWLWIDGITLLPKTATSWYWGKTGKKISFTIPWLSGYPSNTEYLCLAIGKRSQFESFAFAHGQCSANTHIPFICQRIEFFIP